MKLFDLEESRKFGEKYTCVIGGQTIGHFWKMDHLMRVRTDRHYHPHNPHPTPTLPFYERLEET